MKKNFKILITIAGFAVFLVLVWFVYNDLSEKYQAKSPLSQTPTAESSGSPSASEKPKIQAPDFTAIDADGNKVKLSDYKGTPVILNFWASWCPPCKAEMPDFNKVSAEYTNDQLVFLMVDLVDGSRETVETGKKFIEDNKFTFKVLYDTTQEAAGTYGIRSIPSTLFIDKDGYVQAGQEGAMDEETLRNNIGLIYSAK